MQNGPARGASRFTGKPIAPHFGTMAGRVDAGTSQARLRQNDPTKARTMTLDLADRPAAADASCYAALQARAQRDRVALPQPDAALDRALPPRRARLPRRLHARRDHARPASRRSSSARAARTMIDVDGRALTDFWFNATSLPLGHAHPAVVAAIAGAGCRRAPRTSRRRCTRSSSPRLLLERLARRGAHPLRQLGQRGGDDGACASRAPFRADARTSRRRSSSSKAATTARTTT